MCLETQHKTFSKLRALSDAEIYVALKSIAELLFLQMKRAISFCRTLQLRAPSTNNVVVFVSCMQPQTTVSTKILLMVRQQQHPFRSNAFSSTTPYHIDDSTQSTSMQPSPPIPTTFDDIDDSIEVSSEIYDLQRDEDIDTELASQNTSANDGIPTIQSEANVWRNWTDQMLKNQSKEVSLSHVALLIKWWARQRPFTDEAAIVTWKLLDMVDQTGGLNGPATNEETSHKMKQNLINLVIDHWRLSAKTPSVSVPYTAYEIWQRLQHQPSHMLNIRTYAIFVSAISRQNFDALPPHRKGPLSPLALAMEVLQYYMSHRPSAYTTTSDKMSLLVLWNSILTVIAKQGRGPHVGEKAEVMLREMQKDLASSEVTPDAISYACVLDAWVMAAKHNVDAGGNAERILQELVRLMEQTPRTPGGIHEQSLAISICYLHVLRAYCYSETINGADQANYILQNVRNNFLKSLQASRGDTSHETNHTTNVTNTYSNIRPTRHFFSAVMAGYADRGKPAEVERLLFELQSLYESSRGDPMLFPTTATFNSVLEAYARQGTPASAERAQQLLHQLYTNAMKTDTITSASHYSSTVHLKTCLPDTTSVNTCLHAWAQSGAPDAVERAEELLLTTSQWHCVHPDPYSYTSVMKALANSNRPDAAVRCEGILQHMWDQQHQREGSSLSLSSSSSSLCKPNDVTYATAIFCWSTTTDNPDAPLRAEALFKDMRERYHNGDHALKPTLQVYISLILAWAHSPRKEGSVRAQSYFDIMRGQYLAGDETLRPNDKVYRALIESKKTRNDGEGAEMTLNHMYDDYLTHDNTGAKPNRFIFHTVMSAWVNSTNPHAYQRIEAILYRMQQEYKVRKWDCKPNAISYTIFLSCLAKIGTKDAAIRAEKCLRHMYDMSATDDSVKPCRYSCGTVMQAWANTVGVYDAPLRCQAIFDDMIRLSEPPRGDTNIRPSSFTYNSLLTAWARSLHSDAGERSYSILQEMERQHSADPNHFEAPNHFHYTAVISALANKGDLTNVEQILKRMIERRIRPHAGTLNSVLKAYSRSSERDAMDRAETFLRNMECDYSIPPNYVSYTTLVLCIQRSRRPDSFQRAKAVVNEMIRLSAFDSDRSRINKNSVVAPNIATFATLVVALKECTDPKVDKMKELDGITLLMHQQNVEPNTTINKDMIKIRLSTNISNSYLPGYQRDTGSTLLGDGVPLFTIK
jgi:pentatricopeptide repeat protein